MEKIVLGLALAALCALLIFDRRRNANVPAGYTPDPIAADPVGSSPLASANGPAYLTWNRPWLMVPTIGAMLPSKTAAPAALEMDAYNCGSC